MLLCLSEWKRANLLNVEEDKGGDENDKWQERRVEKSQPGRERGV